MRLALSNSSSSSLSVNQMMVVSQTRVEPVRRETRTAPVQVKSSMLAQHAIHPTPVLPPIRPIRS